jgi:hypothetical protein
MGIRDRPATVSQRLRSLLRIVKCAEKGSVASIQGVADFASLATRITAESAIAAVGREAGLSRVLVVVRRQSMNSVATGYCSVSRAGAHYARTIRRPEHTGEAFTANAATRRRPVRTDLPRP